MAQEQDLSFKMAVSKLTMIEKKIAAKTFRDCVVGLNTSSHKTKHLAVTATSFCFSNILG